MATLVLTVIGDDRTGLVNAVAEAVAAHDGNWERSEMAELAGMFAGIVMVTVADDAAAGLIAALEPLDGLTVTVRPGRDGEHVVPTGATCSIDLVGSDRPGIVHDITRVLHRHGVNILKLRSDTRDAPMGGGRLFSASGALRLAATTDVDALRSDLEALANELLVDIDLDVP